MPAMPPPIDLDLTDAVAVYLDRCEAEGFATSTLALYRIILAQFVAYASRQGHTRTTELTMDLALAWQRYLRTEHVKDRGSRRGSVSGRLAPHTVHGYCRTLRTFAGWLADYTDLPINPLAKLRPGRLPKKDVQPLSEDEHRRIIESLDPRTARGSATWPWSPCCSIPACGPPSCAICAWTTSTWPRARSACWAARATRTAWSPWDDAAVPS